MNKVVGRMLAGLIRDRERRRIVRDILLSPAGAKTAFHWGKLSGYTENHVLIGALPTFKGCSGNFEQFPELILAGAEAFPRQLLQLIKRGQKDCGQDTVCVDIHEFGAGFAPEALGALFNAYGSDKAEAHNYHHAYAKLLAPVIDDEISLLEIGLGTNDPAAISTMGVEGKPGASLRAFRDYLPNARIYGADYDRNILFSEERIRTAFVDQTKPETFGEMTLALDTGAFDLIIDDGLHSPLANLNTLLFALDAVKKGGHLVVEDINVEALPVWDIVRRLLAPDEYETFLVRTNSCYIFILHKLQL